MKKLKKKLNPLIIIIGWVVCSLVFTIIVMIELGINTPGGEQKPLIFFTKFLNVVIYGVLFLALLTIPFYIEWSKKYWAIHTFIIIACSLIIFFGIENKVKTKYMESDIDIIVNGKKYVKMIEYYDDNSKIRSITFTYNNKKDSIWTVYSKNGDVISRLRYKEDTLIEKLK